MRLKWGFLMYRSGNLDSAEGILRATLEVSPRTPPAMYALGNTLLAEEEVEEATYIQEDIGIYLKQESPYYTQTVPSLRPANSSFSPTISPKPTNAIDSATVEFRLRNNIQSPASILKLRCNGEEGNSSLKTVGVQGPSLRIKF
ncbi:hypothetical protein K458DRAFT_386350 [Lentithecium fluviatile CBS 122367]|uniref:TPR-like protein n=1 Tax=Lentithecium fluviatile CBS 122367 TaxID=1168545 RepID=A0A6G1JBL9_9PLEO|nr:hypothetical protein K458DRAFT_386350 [Lentithecium fluviatile CBS 122367]